MSSASETVVRAGLALPEKERAEVAARLIDSLEGTPDEVDTQAVDAAWANEAERRFQAYKRGEMGSVPIEEVLKLVRKDAPAP